ncbi:COX15/CtaA family protein [Flavobacterium silvaticum]|nr:COX15/CtaA family protein [Flavobacterium silvaticum]
MSLFLVYCVILAGALVRMTGSGMGCPDWPKCFGYWIPPDDIEQLTWRPGKVFEKGQVIIHDEALWVAKADVTTGQNYNPQDWRAYTKHDYAIFNPTHTWIEYLNRLTGALAGIAVFITAVLSFRLRKKKPSITALSWFTVFLMGFQGWLGATVVYSVLNPIKITIHMIVALLIVAALIYILHLDSRETSGKTTDKRFRNLTWITTSLILVQIIAGTQLRQFVDMQVKIVGEENMFQVLTDPGFVFYFHRSFSIIILLCAFLLAKRSRQIGRAQNETRNIFLILVFEGLTGIAMAYAGFPFGTQAAHLVLASLLFGIIFKLSLNTQFKSNN